MMEYNKYLSSIQPSASIKSGLDSSSANYNLAVGSPDILPPEEISNIIESYTNNPVFRYQPSRGSERALENLHAVVLNSENGINPKKNLILCSGAKLGIYLSLKTITNIGDTVMLLQPYWLSYPDICISLGLNFIDFKLNIPSSNYDFELMKKHIEESKVKVLLINNPNNPAGLVLNNHTISDLAEYCLKRKIWVILDEVYKDITFENKSDLHKDLSKFPNLLRIGSLSKSLAIPGLRLGYVVGNESFIYNYNLFNQHICTSINSFSNYIIENITKKSFIHFTEKCSKLYFKRFKIASTTLTSKGYTVLKSDSTFYILVKVTPKFQDTLSCISELLNKGILVTEGRHYGSQFTEYIRICLTLPESDLKNALKLF